MARTWQQGIYKPVYPEKYIGSVNHIVFRSSWELRAFKFVDMNPAVTRWGSEEVVIPYISPLDGQPHRYFMDLLIQVEDKKGKRIYLIEIKPHGQTQEPRKTAKKKDKTYLHEVKQYSVNQAKWAAAKEFAKKRGWGFKIWTERQLYEGFTTPLQQAKK